MAKRRAKDTVGGVIAGTDTGPSKVQKVTRHEQNGRTKARGTFQIGHDIAPKNLPMGKTTRRMTAASQKSRNVTDGSAKPPAHRPARKMVNTNAQKTSLTSAAAGIGVKGAPPAAKENPRVQAARTRMLGSRVLGMQQKAGTPAKPAPIRTARRAQTTGITDALQWNA